MIIFSAPSRGQQVLTPLGSEQTTSLLVVLIHFPLDIRPCMSYIVLVKTIQQKTQRGCLPLDIVVSNKGSRPLYEQIADQIKGAILRGEAKAGDPLPSIRSLAKALHISILTVQKAYDTLQADGFIETTAGKGCYVAPPEPGLLPGGAAEEDRGQVCRGHPDRPDQRHPPGDPPGPAFPDV